MRVLQRDDATLDEIDEALRHAAEAKASGKDVSGFVDELLDKRAMLTA